MSPGRRRAALGPPAAPEPSVLGARFWRAVRLPVPRREGGPAQRLDLGGRRAAMASPPLAAAAAVGSGGEASSGSEETGTEPPGRDLAALFEQAAERLPSLLPTASKEQLLYLYARYKQVRRDRGGPARPGPTRGLSPGAPRPSVGQSWGPGRRSGTGTGPVREWPGLGLSRPRACVATTRNVTTPSGKSCVGGVWERGLRGAFWPAQSLAPPDSPVAKADEAWEGESPAKFITLVALPRLSPSPSADSPNAAQLASAAETSLWLPRAAWGSEGRCRCGGFGLCSWL